MATAMLETVAEVLPEAVVDSVMRGGRRGWPELIGVAPFRGVRPEGALEERHVAWRYDHDREQHAPDR
jgi:hypothetical protein